jgi:hypothetical protein
MTDLEFSALEKLIEVRRFQADRQMWLERHEPIFRNHDCVRCGNLDRACVRGNPGNCEWPHAKTD